MKTPWQRLSGGARSLAEAMADAYRSQGATEFSMTALRGSSIPPCFTRSRALTNFLAELASHGFGLIRGGKADPVFIIDRSRFEASTFSKTKV